MSDEKITIKQLIILLMNCKFKRCELWTEKEYRLTHSHTKKFRSHMIASKKMDLLAKLGMDYKDAQKWIILEGKQKVNKKELSILGTPLWTGKMEELSNNADFLNMQVCDCYTEGLFRRKIIIILNKSVQEDM